MMKFSKMMPWHTWLFPNKVRYLPWPALSGSARCIFSKTGKWNPELSLQTRLEIEEYWRPLIEESDRKHAQLIDSADGKCRENYYALSMFPYPSGNLHLGHVRVYTISDFIARYQRLLGKRVMHPMGWDAFGLPAENAAIERGINPKGWTYGNIKKMKQQLQELGCSFDWTRELSSCDPSYYRWTQFIFLKMYEKGLAFQKKGLVNWDPVDMTVLADEQIDEMGCSWRSGARVEKKYLTQWFLRNTAFSESLLEGLEQVDSDLWQDVILLQKHWIGECTGHRIEFKVKDESSKAEFSTSIYTENLDLLYGVSHLSVKPSHHLCVDFGITKEGDVLPASAVHPLTGEILKLVVARNIDKYPNRDIILAIPSISAEDRATAERLGISYCQVLDPTESYLANSEELTGLNRHDALKVIRDKVKALGIGGEKISEKLNDWLISRQRYWGTPIPIIHCGKCGPVPVPYEDLPVKLPEIEGLSSKGGHSPLAHVADWVNVACPKCGSEAQRETDTMDTFVDSTWYFLRYLDPHNLTVPFDPKKASRFFPVDIYVGGKEHAVLHLYYARFICHFLHSLGWLDSPEPFKNLLTQGMVKGESFRLKSSGQYLPRENVDFSGTAPVEAGTGAELIVEWEKMSKSKYNGVNPEDVLAEFGLDSTRLCILSNVSPQSDRNWSNIVYKGVLNWQARIWSLVTNQRKYYHDGLGPKGSTLSQEEFDEWERKIADTRCHIINNVNFQFNKTFHINAAISRLHSFVSWLMKVPPGVACSSAAYEHAMADLIIMLCPMAPHFASELWSGLGNVAKHKTHQWDLPITEQSWPKLDDNFLMPVTCRVNGIDMLEVGIPYKDFHTLDKFSALDVVQRDPIYQEKFSQFSIHHISLNVTNDHKATLNLTLPEFDFEIQGSSSEKKKQMKKMSKQKKKLHVMK